jgi:nuclear pore complex protein Nup155
MATPVSAVPPQQPATVSLESAGRLVDEHLQSDAGQLELSAQLKIATHKMTNCSGATDTDYPSLPSVLPQLSSLPFLGQSTHVPLPPELLQEFDKMQCNCAMGLMPETRRAWLTVDSTIYLWKYEDGKDLAYFDGLNEVILTAALISPKRGVFQNHIEFLLCLTTAVDITILGVSFTALQTDPHGEMHLQPSPLFNLPSDNVSMLGAVGTSEGRIFLAGKDSCLYEVVYQAEDGWFSRKCRKVNHSQSSLSFLVPSFLSFSEEDPLIQMVVDSSRHILYTRSSKDTITVYDLGSDGLSLSRVAQIGFRDICRLTLSALRTGDRSLAESLVGVSVLPRSESSTLHLLAVTSAGNDPIKSSVRETSHHPPL